MNKLIRVTVWNEFRHEKNTDHPASKLYPKGMQEAIAEHLRTQPDFKVRTAALDEPAQGLPDSVLDDTDVLIWWGHMAHGEVSDELVDKLQQKIVIGGMGLIVLHSGHFSKIFKRLMGTTCNLIWREADEKERLWIVDSSHPIAEGLGEYFELPQEEMYGERFDIPQPDELVFISWFQGGEVFRSGCCWHRGRGKVFYFRPGHESYPTYRDANVLKVIENAVRWASPVNTVVHTFGNRQPLEKL
ncbi:MAG: ThuA domain-containing protein [Armatimonadetes bacterium]|nr:ThuA domain-containing protein [Armatimonadota bacterium]